MNFRPNLRLKILTLCTKTATISSHYVCFFTLQTKVILTFSDQKTLWRLSYLQLLNLQDRNQFQDRNGGARKSKKVSYKPQEVKLIRYPTDIELLLANVSRIHFGCTNLTIAWFSVCSSLQISNCWLQRCSWISRCQAEGTRKCN